MTYSEFIRQLGVDPANQDPAFLRARESSPEFGRAAAESDRFEHQLGQALTLSEPQNLLPSLKQIARSGARRKDAWRNYALAAGVFLAMITVGVIWRMNPAFDSVEQYERIARFVAGANEQNLQRLAAEVLRAHDAS